jgi:hypothetical protein
MAIKIGELWVSYDDASDVLYLSMGKPQPAITHDDDEGLLIRKHPQTGETVGATVLSYGRHFRHLEDLSWLEKRLPSALAHYLQERPQL